MFRDFSFDPASPPSYSAYEADRATMNVSPTSKTASHPFHLSRPPTPPCTVGDLASILNHQSLRIEARHDCSPDGAPFSPSPMSPPADRCTTPSLDADAAPRPPYSRVAASLLRMQRQSSVRMQCCSSHVRDISRLVQMITKEEQCTISDTVSRTSSTSSAATSTSTVISPTSASFAPTRSDGDEAIDMDYDIRSQGVVDLVGTPQWRADDRRDACIRVTRPVRMRRRPRHRVEKKRSS